MTWLRHYFEAMAKSFDQTPFSILDLAMYPQGKTISDAFSALRTLAQKAEEWGYQRIWMAEHHNLDGVASAATSVLIGYVAGATQSIRVGSGGIMLPNHAPLVIAEQFATLELLYPGRIDLGLGRAPGTDGLTMRALRRDTGARGADFADLLDELLYFFKPAEPGQKIRAIPGAGVDVPIWILGSSLYSADLAAKMGRPYVFAGHFAPAQMLEAFALYRERFQPSEVLEKPYVMVGVPVVAADSDEKAEHLATSLYQRYLSIVRRELIPAPPPVESMDRIWNPYEKAAVQSMTDLLVVGGAEKVKKGLQELIDETQADELMITCGLYDYEDSLRSYEIISQCKA